MSTGRFSARTEAPGRLHLGFLDPGAALGRRFGSIGLAVEGLSTVVRATPAERFEVEGACAGRAGEFAGRVLAHFDLPAAVALTVEAAPPTHAGLGSGTQLALAVGTTVLASFGRTAPAAEVAAALGRGRRSGVGLGLFEQGGLVVDGGHGRDTVTPPVVTRLEFPSAWHALLVLDRSREGLSGRAEAAAFGSLAPMPRTTAAHLCHLTLLGMLPAVAERDFESFAQHVGQVQDIVGDYFAAAQSGRYTSARVADAMAYCRTTLGLAGVGQSSWGPTGFAFVDGRRRAAAARAALEARYGADSSLEIRVCAPCNRGAGRDRRTYPSARRALAG